MFLKYFYLPSRNIFQIFTWIVFVSSLLLRLECLMTFRRVNVCPVFSYITEWITTFVRSSTSVDHSCIGGTKLLHNTLRIYLIIISLNEDLLPTRINHIFKDISFVCLVAEFLQFIQRILIVLNFLGVLG